MDLSKILSQVLEVITINLVWRGILRQVSKSFRKDEYIYDQFA